MRPVASSSSDDTQEQLDLLSAGLDHLAAEVAQASPASDAPVYAPAVVQQVVVPVAKPEPTSAPPMQQATESMVDDLDFDRLAQRIPSRSESDGQRKPAHDEPVIRGFDLQPDEKP